jgi:hypothetical protein
MAPRERDRGRRRWEDEDEETSGIPSSAHQPGRSPVSSPETAKLSELLDRAEPLIEQVNNLYNQYNAGAERRPPIERRQHLDQLIETINVMSKPTPALRFRSQSVLTRYITTKERWERVLKEVEKRGPVNRRKG